MLDLQRFQQVEKSWALLFGFNHLHRTMSPYSGRNDLVWKQPFRNCSPDRIPDPLSDLRESTGPPPLLAFADFLCELAKLLGLFVACFYL
jgi:hypothetical protein